MGRPSTITQPMEDFIRAKLLEHPRPKAIKIYGDLADGLDAQNITIPSESAVIKRITKLRKEIDSLPTNPLDTPWSIGASRKYDIPGFIIPLLLQIKSEEGDKMTFDRLTIRRALWAAKLYPAIEKIANEQHPGDAHWLLDTLDLISYEYARHEQVNETKVGTQRDFPDTSNLDNYLFLKARLSDMALFKLQANRIWTEGGEWEVGKG